MAGQFSLKEIFGSSAGNFNPASAAVRVKNAFAHNNSGHAIEKALSNQEFVAHMRDILSRPYDGRDETPMDVLRTSLHGGIAAVDRLRSASVVLTRGDLEQTAHPGAWAMLVSQLAEYSLIKREDIQEKITAITSRALGGDDLKAMFTCLRVAHKLCPAYVDENKAAVTAALKRALTLPPSTPEQTSWLAMARITNIMEAGPVITAMTDDMVLDLAKTGVDAAVRAANPQSLYDILSSVNEPPAQLFARLTPELQCSALTMMLDHVRSAPPDDREEHLGWYNLLARAMAPAPAAVAERLDSTYDSIVRQILPAALSEALVPGNRRSKKTTVDNLLNLVKPGRALLNELTLVVIDRYIANGDPGHALRIAADTALLQARSGEPVLTLAQAQSLGTTFMACGNHADARLLYGLLSHHPDPAMQALRTELDEGLADIAQDRTPDRVLHELAPILTNHADDTARSFAAFVRALPHETAARAQADMLAPVWEGFERAAPHAKPLGELRPAGAPATAAEMHALSLSVSEYMGVVQTQLPVILPTEESGADILNRMLETQEANRADLSFADFSTRGGGLYAMADEDGGYTHGINFSFLTAQRAHTDVVDGQRVTKRTLISMPVIALDAGILADTMAHGGEGIVRAIQEISGIFNHDYFHHYTATLINPYYRATGGLDVQKIPYMLLKEALDNDEGDEKPSAFNNASAVPRNSRDYLFERWNEYGQNDAAWPVFGSPRADYEAHALHIHNRLYRQYLDDTPVGVDLRQHIDDCADGVAALGKNLADAGKSPAAIAEMKFYYATYLTFNLRRIVPLDHPVMQHAEAAIARMDIDPDECRKIMAKLNNAMQERGHGKRHANVSEMTGVNPAAPDLDPVAAARWNGVRMSVNVLNMLYMDKYADAHAKAIPALREVLSVIRADLSYMDAAGGVTRADGELASLHARHDALHDAIGPVRVPRVDDNRGRETRLAAHI